MPAPRRRRHAAGAGDPHHLDETFLLERTDGVCQVVSQRHLAQHIDRTLAIDHDQYASDLG